MFLHDQLNLRAHHTCHVSRIYTIDLDDYAGQQLICNGISSIDHQEVAQAHLGSSINEFCRITIWLHIEVRMHRHESCILPLQI